MRDTVADMPDNVRAVIASSVRAELARQEKSQRDTAERLGIPQSAVQLRLAGKRAFKAEELAVLVDWLDVPAATFLPTRPSETAA